MMKYILLVVFVLWIFIVTGCSNAGNPVAGNLSSNSENQLMPAGIENKDSTSGVFALFSGYIDAKNLTGELIPVRESQIQDCIESIDITNFLSVTLCQDCVKLHSVYLDADENLVMEIGIRHPLESGNPSLPPTGKNRLDLHLFNVEGVIAIESATQYEFPNLQATVDSKRLLNASGYTSYMDSSLDSFFETGATVHPYILYFRDYSEGNFNPGSENGFSNVTNPSGYCVMPMGSDEDIKQYVLNLGENEILQFLFAVNATFGIAAGSIADRLNPVYCLPQFNKKAASEVQVKVLENNLVPGRTTSSAKLGIEVLDLNYNAEVGGELNQVRALSKVSRIAFEIPGVAQVVKWNPSPTGGDPKDPDNPLTFQLEFFNHSGGMEGVYNGLVKVTDSYPAGTNTAAILSGKDGISRVDPTQNPLEGLFSIDEFNTWQYFTIEIFANEQPIADLDVSSEIISTGGMIDLFPGPGTMDPDGAIVKYEYDFNYDGITFDIDSTNTTGDPVTTDPMINPTFDPVTCDVAMRVTDNGDPEKTAIDAVSITINPYETTGWARSWGGFYDDHGFDVAVDSNSNTYITGSFSDTVDFDPGWDIDEKTASGTADVYLMRFDEFGNLAWVVTWGADSDSPDGDSGFGVAVKDQNIYVIGKFYGTVDFDPGAGEANRLAKDYGDIFLSKFDQDGNFQWVQTWGDTGVDLADDIAIDSFGNIYVSGAFEGTVDFNPSTGTDNHSATGWINAFVTKFNSNGDFQWARTWGKLLDRGYGVTVDGSDNVYVTGTFQGTVDFDPGVDLDEWTSNGKDDIFLTKFDSFGNHQWAVAWGSAGEFYWQRDAGFSVATDSNGFSYVTGIFFGTCDFDPDADVDEKTANGFGDAFISKFDSSGLYQWSLTWGSENDDLYHGDSGNSIEISPYNDIFITGGFYSTVDFDPGANVTEYTSNGNVDVYLSKLSADGELLWTRTWGGFGLDDGLAVAVDSHGTAFVTGYFSNQVDFDPSGDVDTHESNGDLDIYLSKFPGDGEW
jgi:hypothetical protein